MPDLRVRIMGIQSICKSGTPGNPIYDFVAVGVGLSQAVNAGWTFSASVYYMPAVGPREKKDAATCQTTDLGVPDDNSNMEAVRIHAEFQLDQQKRNGGTDELEVTVTPPTNLPGDNQPHTYSVFLKTPVL